MLIVSAIVIAVVLGLAVRHAPTPDRRAIVGLAALALGIRLAASIAIYFIAIRTHGEGLWLNDEASFWLATESLLPNPLDRNLPLGLDHLAGDGYLGLTTVIAMLFGNVADSNAYRFINAGLGALVVVLSTLVARRLFGLRAAIVSGIGLAVWPLLVLWSATILRDTLGSLAVVAVWWTLGRSRDAGWVRTISLVLFALVIAFSLRPYLGGAILTGVAAWAAYPLVRKLSRTGLAAVAAAIVVGGVFGLLSQARAIDFAEHELLYRQTVTRMETLGRLYTDTPPATADLPMKPGTAVALADPPSGWLLTGVIQDFPHDGLVQIAFVDESVRDVPLADVQLIQSARIPPLQLVAWVAPNLIGFVAGTAQTGDMSSPVWTIGSLAWDVLVLIAVVTCVRRRLGPTEWLFPLCVIIGTVMALVAVPGAPGNADRHRETQTVPLLLVLASGLVVSRVRAVSGLTVASTRMRPASEATDVISRMRSAR
ncbi:MAG TPA: hypothetical protein VGQ62_22730 [Chloroflexota bacterium]|jgi:hypothetical protein|nr:hypothetical protein [Chloroflexota bacterium]